MHPEAFCSRRYRPSVEESENPVPSVLTHSGNTRKRKRAG